MPGNPVVTGIGTALGVPCDSRPYLRDRKNRKFMGPQDELAVVAAARAIGAAGHGGDLGDRASLFLAVGHIPFEEEDIDLLLAGSTEGDAISMERFSTDGLPSVNPLLTFRCLPNMPAFHVSLNFGIRGGYFVTYPGPGQFYAALDRACDALATGLADIAVVGGVAHQRNFLVQHHHRRLGVDVESLRDAAGCLVLEREEDARRRGQAIRARILDLSLGYRPHDPFGEPPESAERLDGAEFPAGELGPAALVFALAEAPAGTVRHMLQARDGLRGASAWEVG